MLCLSGLLVLQIFPNFTFFRRSSAVGVHVHNRWIMSERQIEFLPVFFFGHKCFLVGTGFAAESGQIRKIGHFQTFEVETLYQPYFRFWLFAWSRCGRIVKKSSRKDSLYQHYTDSLTSAPPWCHRQPSAFVREIARNIWKQAGSILVEKNTNQNIEVLLFW